MKGSTMSDNYEEKEVTFLVEGMHCEHCAQTIEREVGRLMGVSKVFADLSGNAAQVVFNPSETSTDEIVNTISEAGFSAKEA